MYTRLKMIKYALTFFGGLLACLTSLAMPASAEGEKGWYLVLGSFTHNENRLQYPVKLREAHRFSAQINGQCRIRSKVADIMASTDFRADVVMVYIGPFRDPASAERARSSVLTCVPDAYSKFGSFVIAH